MSEAGKRVKTRTSSLRVKRWAAAGPAAPNGCGGGQRCARQRGEDAILFARQDGAPFALRTGARDDAASRMATVAKADADALLSLLRAVTAERDILKQRCQSLSAENATLRAQARRRTVVVSDEEDGASESDDDASAPSSPAAQSAGAVVPVTASRKKPPGSASRRRAVVSSEDESEGDGERGEGPDEVRPVEAAGSVDEKSKKTVVLVVSDDDDQQSPTPVQAMAASGRRSFRQPSP